MTEEINNLIIQGFIDSVKSGLSSKIKTLSSKYFYDDAGSRIFQKIMNMPEYYLTDAEFEILNQQAGSILESLPYSSTFNIVELGAGDGKKTIRLLDYFQKAGVAFNYIPIDISEEAIEMLKANVAEVNDKINVRALVGDYFDMLDTLKETEEPTLLLFLGSNLGNFHLEDAHDFIGKLSQHLKPKDTFLLGLDLQKNPNTIRRAYNDVQGITRSFNLNLLKRINRELGGNFDMDQWDFYASYNPINGEVRSYLISLKKQEVHIDKVDMTFSFEKDELIYTELSRKYTLSEIELMATKNNFSLVNFFQDSKGYFVDGLFVR